MDGKLLQKEIFSPFDISRICQVTLEQVLAWLRGDKIPFFLTPSGHRRILRSDLAKFLKGWNPAKTLENGREESGYRVLVVEDDLDLLEIVGDLLKIEMGVEVRMEANGFNAGLQIASWHPDLILLDFVVPGMNGFEVCRKLQENPETADIPVLALTALTHYEARKAIMASGVADFLGKPFGSEQLLQKIRVLLGLSNDQAKSLPASKFSNIR